MALLVGALVGVTLDRGEKTQFAMAAQQTRTVKELTSDKMTLSNGYEVGIASSGLDGWTLAKGGSILNTVEIRGIDSIEVTYEEGGCLQLMGAWKGYDNNETMTIDWGNDVTGGSTSAKITFDANQRPDFFNIYAEKSTTITGITFVYECATDTTVSSFRFSISALHIGEEPWKALDASNHVWIETNFTGSTTQICLDYDVSVGYYHDFADVPVSGGIWFNTYLVRSDSVFSSGCKSTNANYSHVNAAPGMTYLVVDHAAFGSQPSDATYSFDVTVTPTWNDGSSTQEGTKLWIVGDPALFGETGNNWTHHQMVKNNGVYGYSFENVPEGSYGYTICATKDDNYVWNPRTQGDGTLVVGSNDDQVLTGTWATQPGMGRTLTITYTEGSGTYWSTGRGIFILDSDDLTTADGWTADFTWVSGNTYTCEYDTNSDVIYLALAVYVEGANRYVGTSTTKAFKVSFTSTNASFDVTATFNSVESRYSGTASNAVGCTVA